MSDWTETDLKQRSIAATEYRGYANIPVGDDTYELPYKLLNGKEILDVQADINISAIAEKAGEIDVSDETSDAQETVEELQAKDELTDAEETQLREAQTTLASNRGELADAMGRDTLQAFRNAGRKAISPDSDDVNNVMNSGPNQIRARFEDIDDAPPMTGSEITREQINRALTAEMREILDASPFMVFFTIGQEVWEESQDAGKLVGPSDSET